MYFIMAKAKKLPSGNYRVLYYVDGEPHSVTRATPKEAELAALQHQTNKKRANTPAKKTLSKAIDDYIELKSNILSPSTIYGYRQIQRNAYPLLLDLPLSKITTKAVQKQINQNSAHYSPKSVSNHYGLLSAVLKNEEIELGHIALKPKEKTEIRIPAIDEIKQMIKIVEGTNDLEIFILFVLLCGLRPSEAVALQWENYDGKSILVKGSVVINENREYVYKTANKTYHSTRKVDIPSYLNEKLQSLQQKEGAILNRKSTSYYFAFKKLLKKHNMPHYRVYDLRHAYASIMLYLGVPDKYAMERMGHSTPNMLKTVYQHTFKSEQENISQRINDFWVKTAE